MALCTLELWACWLRVVLTRLRADARLVVIAAAQAQKAADYIVGADAAPAVAA
jgi:antirestriction protein ArdC